MAEVIVGGLASIGTFVTKGAVAAAGTAAAANAAVVSTAAAATIGAASVAVAAYGITSSLLRSNSALDSLNSPTYSFGTLVTQTNSALPFPIIYGEVKLAGNVLWQDGTTTLQRLTSFGGGEIEEFTDIRINDTPIGEIAGATYDAYTGNGTQSIDSRVPGATNGERAEVVGGLKHEAYIACSVNASAEVNGNFTITSIVKGKKVRVYTDLITFSIEYSSNPAWCLLDYLTSYEGLSMPLEELDIDSFIEAAQYCNATVNGKKRFACNLVLDSKKSALDTIEDFCLTCRGLFGKRGDKWFFMIDKSEAVSANYDSDDIVDFTSWFLKMDEVFDVVNINYRDPNHEWTFVQARAEADEYSNEVRPIIKNQDIHGITEFEQASRQGWFYLNQSHITPMFCKFKINKRAYSQTVGDVIAITDPLYGFNTGLLQVQNLKTDILNLFVGNMMKISILTGWEQLIQVLEAMVALEKVTAIISH